MINKASKLRQMSQLELERLLLDDNQKLFQLRFEQKSGQLKDQLKIRMIKREIARIKTILNEKNYAMRG